MWHFERIKTSIFTIEYKKCINFASINKTRTMDANISLDGLLSFIHSLSLNANNKQWLGEKLLEEARLERTKQNYNDFINNMCGAWKDDPRTTEEITDSIRNARQFDTTRHITTH